MGNDTGMIRKIAFAHESETPPTNPATGSNINWNSLRGTWDVVGNVNDGDVASLAEDSIGTTPREESVEEDAPLAQNRTGYTVYKNGVDEVSFAMYSVTDKARALSSTAQRTANNVEETTDVVYKTMVVEIAGVGYDYYPRVRVKLGEASGSIKEVAALAVTVGVCGGWYNGLEIPSGCRWYGNSS